MAAPVPRSRGIVSQTSTKPTHLPRLKTRPLGDDDVLSLLQTPDSSERLSQYVLLQTALTVERDLQTGGFALVVTNADGTPGVDVSGSL